MFTQTDTAYVANGDATRPSARAAHAHALKNCLSVVYAVSHLVHGELTDRGRERLARLRAAVCRMNLLIDEDLRPSRSARVDLSAVVSVEEVVRSVVDRVEDCAERAGVRLVVRCERGSVRGDASLLVEALHNVVSNAITASPVRGVVRLTTSVTPDGYQEWLVADRGCGMTPDVLRDVGTPYYSKREGGSGLGIAVARDTIRSHGGALDIDSEPGAGTTVRMWIPCEGD